MTTKHLFLLGTAAVFLTCCKKSIDSDINTTAGKPALSNAVAGGRKTLALSRYLVQRISASLAPLKFLRTIKERRNFL